MKFKFEVQIAIGLAIKKNMEINRNSYDYTQNSTLFYKYPLNELSDCDLDFKLEFSYMYLVYCDICIHCTLF